MKKHVWIVTGTSRGIGEAIASQLIGTNNHVICISRTQNPGLQVQAITRNTQVKDIAFDLSNTEKIPELMQDVFRELDPDAVSSVSLINNAGTVQPVKMIGQSKRTDLVEASIKINLVAPVIATEWFVRLSEEWNVPRRVVNISTGAARRPVQGWASYCTAKAGLEMFSQCLKEEQAGSSNPVKVLAFAPGVVDTEMQAEIRGADESHFPEVNRFREMKTDGALLSPSDVAKELLAALASPEFGGDWFLRITR